MLTSDAGTPVGPTTYHTSPTPCPLTSPGAASPAKRYSGQLPIFSIVPGLGVLDGAEQRRVEVADVEVAGLDGRGRPVGQAFAGARALAVGVVEEGVQRESFLVDEDRAERALDGVDDGVGIDRRCQCRVGRAAAVVSVAAAPRSSRGRRLRAVGRVEALAVVAAPTASTLTAAESPRTGAESCWMK